MAYTDHSQQRRTNKSKQKKNIKSLQLNLQHSRAANFNLAQIILQYNIDIAFVQEPYRSLNNVAGFPKSFRIFAIGNNGKRSAIIVNNNHVDVLAITQVSHEDIILTEIRYKGLTFYGASLYLHIDRDIERDLEAIEDIIQLTKGQGLLLAIDSNVRSKLWSDTCTNTRGRTLEEFIITRDLFIINEATDIPTFETNRGRSWIDITLSNNILEQKTTGWTCGQEESCSDIRSYFSKLNRRRLADLEHPTKGNATIKKRTNGQLPIMN
jgi:hypothetical protein